MLIILFLYSVNAKAIYYLVLLILLLVVLSLLIVLNYNFKSLVILITLILITFLSFYSKLNNKIDHSLTSLKENKRVEAIVLGDSCLKNEIKTCKIRIKTIINKDSSRYSDNKVYTLCYHSKTKLYYQDNISFDLKKINKNIIFATNIKSYNNSIFKYRKNLISFINKKLEKCDYKALLDLLIYASSDSDTSFYKDFGKTSSLTHTMVVSGLHLHLIIYVITLLFYFVKNKKPFIIIFILFYLYLVTPKISILRSSITYIIVLLFGFSINFSLYLTLLLNLMFFNQTTICLTTSLSYSSVYVLIKLNPYISLVTQKLILPSFVKLIISSSITCSLFSTLILLLNNQSFNSTSIIATFFIIILIPLLFLLIVLLILTSSSLVLNLLNYLCLIFRKILILTTKYSTPYYLMIIIYLIIGIIFFYINKKISINLNNYHKKVLK